MLLQDKTIESQEDSSVPPSTGNPSMGGVTQTRKVKVRQTFQDKGVFKTGVEVVEHDIEVDEDDEGKIQALRLYRDGKLTTSQMRDILLR